MAATGQIMTLAPWGRFGFAWDNLNRWDDLIAAAAEEFGDRTRPHPPDLAPATLAGVIKAMMAIESGGQMYDAEGDVFVRDDGFGDGLSVGLMQVKPAIWQDLVPDADAYTPRGNIRLGAAIMAQAIRDHGSWETALTKVYFPAPDPNGTTQNEYVTAVRGLLNEMGAFDPDGAQPTDGGGPAFRPFPAPRLFTVRPEARATGRRGPSRGAVWVRDFAPNEVVTCDGVFAGEAIQGDGRWLRVVGPSPLAVHASAFNEPVDEGADRPAEAGTTGGAGGGDPERRMVVTTVATRLRDAPGGEAMQTLPVGTRLRVTGEREHGFLPVAIPGQHVRGWVDRDDVARIEATGPAPGGGGAPAPDPGADAGPTAAGDVGARIAAEARRYVGFPYVLATRGPATFDCSGLVHWVVRQVTGQEISPDSHAQFNLGQPVNRGHLRPGDLVFYDTMRGGEVREGNAASHVGIVVGDGEMVNALNEERGVILSDPFSAYFAPLYLGARRLA